MNETELFSEKLEAFVDKHGLQTALQLLESICFEKATHLLTNWQGEAMAQRWEAAALAIEKLSVNQKIRAVS